VPSNKLSWTAEENERLKKMVEQGASAFRAAAAFNRSSVSVRNQARKLGVPFPTLRSARQKATLAISTREG
jgi:hypothetical protein